MANAVPECKNWVTVTVRVYDHLKMPLGVSGIYWFKKTRVPVDYDGWNKISSDLAEVNSERTKVFRIYAHDVEIKKDTYTEILPAIFETTDMSTKGFEVELQTDSDYALCLKSKKN